MWCVSDGAVVVVVYLCAMICGSGEMGNEYETEEKVGKNGAEND